MTWKNKNKTDTICLQSSLLEMNKWCNTKTPIKTKTDKTAVLFKKVTTLNEKKKSLCSSIEHYKKITCPTFILSAHSARQVFDSHSDTLRGSIVVVDNTAVVHERTQILLGLSTNGPWQQQNHQICQMLQRWHLSDHHLCSVKMSDLQNNLGNGPMTWSYRFVLWFLEGFTSSTWVFWTCTNRI